MTKPAFIRKFPSIWRKYRNQALALITIACLVGIGVYLYNATRAAAPYVTAEAESGTVSLGAVVIDDSTASGGKAVRFQPTAAAVERWSTLHPFLSSAFSNISVGSGILTDPNSVKNDTLQLHTPYLNSARWSVPVYEASAANPSYTITDRNGTTFTFQIPNNAAAALGTDMHMSVTQPDKRTNYEMFGAAKTTTGQWTAKYMVKGDLLSTGMTAGARASGVSHLHGIIRAEEVAKLHIPHSLALGVSNDQLKTGPVWPARQQDGDASTAYTGTIPMGTMFVLPRSVNIDSLGLTPAGRALAWTLQNYGTHVLIRAGTVAFYAEPDAEAQNPAKINDMRAAWTQLRPLMEVVTNNTSTNVAGGGTRLQPALPEVIAK
jgi:hypothetical protein